MAERIARTSNAGGLRRFRRWPLGNSVTPMVAGHLYDVCDARQFAFSGEFRGLLRLVLDKPIWWLTGIRGISNHDRGLGNSRRRIVDEN